MEEEDLFDEFAASDGLENLRINSSEASQNSNAETNNRRRPRRSQPPRSTTPSYDNNGELRRRGARTPRHGSGISTRSSLSGSSS